jgi:hypothetical protein
MLVNKLVIANESGQTVFHDQMKKLRVIPTPLLGKLKVNVQVLRVNGV